jgi:hypothetical protein
MDSKYYKVVKHHKSFILKYLTLTIFFGIQLDQVTKFIQSPANLTSILVQYVDSLSKSITSLSLDFSAYLTFMNFLTHLCVSDIQKIRAEQNVLMTTFNVEKYIGTGCMFKTR